MSVTKCFACRDGISKPVDFSMAFQPIVDTEAGRTYAYEALVRGPQGEPAHTILSRINKENRYAFDQACRVEAITLASRLRLQDTGAFLSINFLPGAVYSPVACIRLTLETARQAQFPPERLIFEITETEEVDSPEHIQAIVDEYHRQGLLVAIDDFGAGYSNLNLLADLPANVLKLDMGLIRNIHERPRAQAIVRSIGTICKQTGISLVAEGIETLDEYHVVADCGIRLMQGYLFAKPLFQKLPDITLPKTSAARRPSVPAALLNQLGTVAA